MKFYLLAIIVLLSGCSTVPTAYNPNNLNKNQLVKVTTLQEKGIFNSNYNAWIEFVWNDSEEEITKRNSFWDGMLGEISLPSGKYKFQVACLNGVYEGHPKAIFKLETGKNYQISCEIGKGKNILGMSVDSNVSIKIVEI